MRFVTVRELRNTPAVVWSALESDDLIVTSNGDPVALMLRIEGGDLTHTLATLTRARAQQALSKLRDNAARNGTANVTDEEVESEIYAARRARNHA